MNVEPELRRSDIERVADALRLGERFLLTTHEAPDGDALGSLVATHLALRQLGRDSVMFLAAKEFPLPVEYRFLPLEEVFHEPPADVVDRSLVFLDCGNIDRMPVDFLKRDGASVLNIDHHHDNTRFGTINLVDVEASSTCEIVYELALLLDVEVTPAIAEAIYVGLVTDTGRFMYENTRPSTHRCAAALIEAGVDVHRVYRRLYERVPVEKAKLLARALSKVEMHDEGRLALTYLSADDFREADATGALTEGIIDYLRAIEGAQVAGLIRDQEPGASATRKVSLRATGGDIDVSIIARTLGGGGHRQAAGFSTDMTYRELVEFVREQVAAQR